jgi:hypothetical protein
MKKQLTSRLSGSTLLTRSAMKFVKGGAGGLFPVYECRVSQKGYTAGFICLMPSDARPETMCNICWGVSYAVLHGNTTNCYTTCI